MNRWKPEEVAKLKELYGTMPISAIANEIGRTKNSVAAKARTLRLDRQPPVFALRLVDDPGEDGAADEGEADTYSRLRALRDRMEQAIEADMIPPMQQPAYFREYRALLAELDELRRRGDGEEGEAHGPSIAEAIASLAEQQRRYLEQAAVS